MLDKLGTKKELDLEHQKRNKKMGPITETLTIEPVRNTEP